MTIHIGNSRKQPADDPLIYRQSLCRPTRPPFKGVSTICFSASASMASGIALLAIGAITVRRTGAKTELPFAAIPLIFGVQQLIEGGLWLGLPAQIPATHVLVIAYLLIANVLWPVYAPAAVWLIEPDAVRRRRILFPLAIGAATSLFFLVAMIAHPVSASIKGAHIDYKLPQSPSEK